MSYHPRLFAYLSMEIGLEALIPSYSGGLGVLAGDTLRSAADLEVPLAAVSLAHRHGYFKQVLSEQGWQSESPMPWNPAERTQRCDPIIEVTVDGRIVHVAAWRYLVHGVHHFAVPVYLLDTNLPVNCDYDRTLTDNLYGGDRYYRLCQEVILGEGGVKMLRALGYDQLRRFHLNEGHAALVVPTLMQEYLTKQGLRLESAGADRVLGSARRQCIFTTHTPVEAGHDKFSSDLARQVLGQERWDLLRLVGQEHALNMTEVALRGSHFVNGVAMRHGQVSRALFPGYPIHSITNGIHACTWASKPFQVLFDRHLPNWRHDSFSLRHAICIPTEELWQAHEQNKQELFEFVRDSTGIALDPGKFTIGFGRRATAYKRALLVFRDLERLRSIARLTGGLQFVFGGKAHPHDTQGKEIIQNIHEISKTLGADVRVAFLANYDMNTCRKLVAGADVWLNTPYPPLEASGTSGMKAALNGVPSLSVLDGWWVEGCSDGVTGWQIGEDLHGQNPQNLDLDALHGEELYRRLEQDVVPTFYGNRKRFLAMMQSSISMNASFFNTERMMSEYYYSAYRERSHKNSPDPIAI